MYCPILQDQVITRTVYCLILQDLMITRTMCCPKLQEDPMISRKVQPSYLSDVMVGGCDDLVQGCGWDLDALPEGNGHHGTLDLLHTGALEPQVQAIV